MTANRAPSFRRIDWTIIAVVVAILIIIAALLIDGRTRYRMRYEARLDAIKDCPTILVNDRGRLTTGYLCEQDRMVYIP